MVHSSRQDQRRQQHLERAIQASSTTLEATVREAARQEDCCHTEAEAAAATRRALQSTDHRVQGGVGERPTDGPGRPSLKPPRVVNALRYGLQVTRHARAEVIARRVQEAGCCALRTHVPHGVEQHVALLQDPIMVNRLLLKKPERIEALGLVFRLAWRLWRLVERALQAPAPSVTAPQRGWRDEEGHRRSQKAPG